MRVCFSEAPFFRDDSDIFSKSVAEEVREFHSSFDEYSVTPLVELDALADFLGVGKIYVKDESPRFTLNAFKAMGGSYAIARVLAERSGLDPHSLSLGILRDVLVRHGEKLTFITATDGNHGRGVAWMAHKLGQRCVVHMPCKTVAERLRNVQVLGAEADILPMNYDDTVRYSAREAEEKGYLLIQDTAWEGYTRVPEWITRGYLTMSLEAFEQMGGRLPTHIFLQAGVGAMASSVAAFFVSLCRMYGKKEPVIVLAEPRAADCFYRSASAGDGRIHPVTGSLSTMMAGLACGEPSLQAWDILSDCVSCYLSLPDSLAAVGMRILGAPMGTDPRVISGESGAAGFAALVAVLQNGVLRNNLGLDASSRVFCISTEGATDVQNYRRIVWNGGVGASCSE